MIIENIAELNLNDSQILEINIHKRVSRNDIIEIIIDYIVDYDLSETKICKLIFSGCLNAILNINYNINSPESIADGRQSVDPSLLKYSIENWKKVGIDFTGKIKYYRIETCTSNSIIEIVAQKLEFVEC